MTSDPHSGHGRRFLHIAQEYLTHWTVAGSIVVITGFGPEHWFADIIGHFAPEKMARALQGFDIRIVLVAIGVAIIAWDVIRRSAAQRHLATAGGHPQGPALAEPSGRGGEVRRESPVSGAATHALPDMPSIAVCRSSQGSQKPGSEHDRDREKRTERLSLLQGAGKLILTACNEPEDVRPVEMQGHPYLVPLLFLQFSRILAEPPSVVSRN